MIHAMRKASTIFYFLLLFIPSSINAQVADSTQVLDSVTVKAFEQIKPVRYSPVSISIISSSIADYSNKTSLVNGLNAISGVRMEERSPGSYRINIRGSSLRSPFGVRNIKVYWNDIPVTDPGGNTYFNQFAWNNFSDISVVKGPAASMYGAGTGGLILLNNFSGTWKPGISAEYTTGSYNLQNVFATARFGQKENKHQVSYAHNQTDGYRVQTNMRRDNFSWVSNMKGNRYDLTASLLFTDMYYQTPGALTLAEFTADPKAARPAGGGFPSAVNAKAAIFQKNLLAGFTNVLYIADGLKNTSTLYGSYTQVKNSAIRNYERRIEPSFGGRTVFNYTSYLQKGLKLGVVAGAEFQQGYFNTQVSKNRNGNPDTLQTNDDTNNQAYVIFLQSTLELANKWHFLAGASINRTKLEITRLSRYPVTRQSRTYRNELAPKFSLLRNFNEKLIFVATVSKGFSPPTIAEVLPSTGVISTDLEAEQGWNYEATLRSSFFKNKLNLELTGFYFRLNDALVQRRDAGGADFFVNAGDIQQKGVELHADYRQFIISNFFRSITARTDVTLNHFRYGSFIKGSDDFSGNELPSVPSTVFSLLTELQFNYGIYLNASYYAASSIYMNDANTAKADPYHLLGCQLGWKKKDRGTFRLSIYAGIDNLLDENYSLGNDINAAGNRFYNAAPRRNYYAGVSVQWIKQKK
jgi:iron complex outermembrane recepter protein